MRQSTDGFILVFVLVTILLVSMITLSVTSSLLANQAFYNSLENVYNQKATAYWIVYTNKNDVE